MAANSPMIGIMYLSLLYALYIRKSQSRNAPSETNALIGPSMNKRKDMFHTNDPKMPLQRIWKAVRITLKKIDWNA